MACRAERTVRVTAWLIGPGGQADLAVQVVGVGVAEAFDDRGNLAGQQPVQGPAGAEVQRVAYVQQLLVRAAGPPRAGGR